MKIKIAETWLRIFGQLQCIHKVPCLRNAIFTVEPYNRCIEFDLKWGDVSKPIKVSYCSTNCFIEVAHCDTECDECFDCIVATYIVNRYFAQSSNEAFAFFFQLRNAKHERAKSTIRKHLATLQAMLFGCLGDHAIARVFQSRGVLRCENDRGDRISTLFGANPKRHSDRCDGSDGLHPRGPRACIQLRPANRLIEKQPSCATQCYGGVFAKPSARCLSNNFRFGILA